QSLDERVLTKMPRLRYLGVLGTSLKQLPLEYLKKHDVKVTNVTNYCDDETAEWVFMRILKFFRENIKAQSVCEKKIGIIGVGAIGKKIVHLAKAFKMEIFYNTSLEHKELEQEGAQFLSKEKIFTTCDVVSLQTPAFFSWLTRDLLDHAKTNLCLIN